jgi:hypothetical protein
MQDGRIVEKRSMHMPGLDDGHVDKGDSDLEVEEESEEKGLIGWIYATWSSLLF